MGKFKKLVKKFNSGLKGVTKITSKVTGGLQKVAKVIPVYGATASKVLGGVSKVTGKVNNLLDKPKLVAKVKKAQENYKGGDKSLKAGFNSNKQSKQMASPKRSEYSSDLSPSQKQDVDKLKTFVNTYSEENRTTKEAQKQSFIDWFLHGRRE